MGVNQEDESSILRNEEKNTSEEFKSFVASLGWEVGCVGGDVDDSDDDPIVIVPVVVLGRRMICRWM